MAKFTYQKWASQHWSDKVTLIGLIIISILVLIAQTTSTMVQYETIYQEKNVQVKQGIWFANRLPGLSPTPMCTMIAVVSTLVLFVAAIYSFHTGFLKRASTKMNRKICVFKLTLASIIGDGITMAMFFGYYTTGVDYTYGGSFGMYTTVIILKILILPIAIHDFENLHHQINVDRLAGKRDGSDGDDIESLQTSSEFSQDPDVGLRLNETQHETVQELVQVMYLATHGSKKDFETTQANLLAQIAQLTHASPVLDTLTLQDTTTLQDVKPARRGSAVVSLLMDVDESQV